MSDVKNLWVLKPDVIIDEYKDIRIVRPSHGSSFIQEIPSAVFDKLFQPLDVESLTTQLEDKTTFLCQAAFEAGASLKEKDRKITGVDVDKAIKQFVAEVLELIGMKGKDNE